MSVSNETPAQKTGVERRLIWFVVTVIVALGLIVWLSDALSPKPAIEVDTGTTSVSIGADGISVTTTPGQ